MERVQFQQEQMLDELKDLVEKNLFTEKETKQIMKRRTAFETALVRRVAQKADFLRYAAYEMGLEQLRRKRVERTRSESGPQTVSDYALVRRQFHIFERALRKFKSDVGLWIQYIQVAKREGARALVGRVTARALQLHPNKPALYVLAASHELDHLSHSAARTLLQRGIRLNPESVEIWREYVRMELGFVESLRRRWDVLGINTLSADKGKGKAAIFDDPSDRIIGGRYDDDEYEPPQGTVDMDDEIEGTDARKEIMGGAIVKSVISSAILALPKIELFESLNVLLLEYPSHPSVRQTLLDHLHGLLRSTLPDDAGAIKLLAQRFLSPDLEGEAFVEGLKDANEEILQRVRESRREAAFQAYATFVEEWCGAAIDTNLKQYLVASLRSLMSCHEHADTSPSLLSVHVRLMISLAEAGEADPAKVLRTARRYTTKAPKSPHVWLARLGAEKQFATEEGRGVVDSAWASARRLVEGSEEELKRVWTWGLVPEGSVAERLKIHEGLLKETMRDASLRGLHETLLIVYVRTVAALLGRGKPDSGSTSDQANNTANLLNSIRHMASSYLTTGKVWQQMFSIVQEENWGSETRGKMQVLGEVFEKWQKKDRLEATLEWARWLLDNGEGKEATEVVVAGGRGLTNEDRTDLESRWMGIVGNA